MELIPLLHRKHGSARRCRRFTRSWTTILAETYGIMVYQEQVMQIFNQLGGIELTTRLQADQGHQQEKDLDDRGQVANPFRPVRRATASQRKLPRRFSR